jgi:hypothetical protein
MWGWGREKFTSPKAAGAEMDKVLILEPAAWAYLKNRLLPGYIVTVFLLRSLRVAAGC